MHGQRIGYVRVSSFDQNPERQLEHVQVDRLFTDKASGKDTQRPELVAQKASGTMTLTWSAKKVCTDVPRPQRTVFPRRDQQQDGSN